MTLEEIQAMLNKAKSAKEVLEATEALENITTGETMTCERWQHAGLKFTITDNDTGVTTVFNGDNEAEEAPAPVHDVYERNMQKEFGRTVLRIYQDDKTTFAQLLEADLKNSKYTIAQVADMIGTSSTSVNKWKSGKVYPAIHFAYRIAQLLHGDEWQTAFIMYTRKIDKER